MTPDTAGIEAALAAGLAAHERVVGIRDLRLHCTCGWESDERVGIRAHRAHVAAALLPVVTQAQAGAWDAGYARRGDAIAAFGKGAPIHLNPPNPYRARADESGAR